MDSIAHRADVELRRRLSAADAAFRLALASGAPEAPMQQRNISKRRSPREARLAEANAFARRTSRSKQSTEDSISLPSLSSRSRSSCSTVDLQEVKHEQVEAQQKVATLRAQLARAERLERQVHVEEARQKRRDQAMAVRSEEELLVEKLEQGVRMQSIRPVSHEEGRLLEALFNERLRARYHVATNLQPEEDGAIRWLCKKVERRHDDTVSLLPFTRIVREVLSLSEAELPQRQMLSLWLSGLKPIPIPDARRALGTTTAPPVKPPATVTLRDIQQFFRRGGIGESRVDNQAIAASVRAELTERIRAPPEAMFGGATAASRADVRALAELMNEQMVGLFAPNERSFYHLFKFMDTDGSEVIEFDEFESMVRKQLRLGPQEVPFDRLLGLWRAIDADGSGRVCAGEFGRFMRFGCADSLSEPKGAVTPRRTRISQGGNPMADAQARLRAHRARQRDKETDDSQGEAARRVKQSARGLDMEAQRLAAQIAEKERSARGRH